ncbi:GNAT family N-acetyltransferase [Streptomyces sp. MST-110588]|uniref:GNAT family N-acetyltransferase n=1 Tax=Streptomyces sp. MST-110588 TaxID=2833628 RepID=UPI001F5DB869|nr:GNAT family N-acetyltransferase [Streptomyces sp. MST-110588]UNO43301.1 GNAT family N-acetyltransferase [Streptomyces sp. MST-110588]
MSTTGPHDPHHPHGAHDPHTLEAPAFGSVGTLVYRSARPEDDAAIEAIDGSFTTDTVFEVVNTGTGFTIRPTAVDPPIHKEFPDDEDVEDDDGDEGEGEDDERSPDVHTVVAVDGGHVCGFLTTKYASWNRRLTIADVEVAPTHRGQGVGRTLLRHAVDRARALGASHVWLEVTNINAPAIRAYLRFGFTFCGLDTSLYDGTASAGETALFMSLPCTDAPSA